MEGLGTGDRQMTAAEMLDNGREWWLRHKLQCFRPQLIHKCYVPMDSATVDSSRKVLAFVTIDSAILRIWKLGQRMKELKELEAYHFVPTLVLPSIPPPLQSPKCLSLREVINNSIAVNRPARQLKGSKEKYGGTVNEAAWERCGGKASVWD